MKRESFAFTALVVSCWALVACPLQSANSADSADVFATVDGVSITKEAFEREVYAAARQTFYHGRPPGAEEYIEFRKGVADRMIERRLLLEEARRRGLRPDEASIDAQIAKYEARYGDTDRWQSEGPAMVAALRERFEEDSILEALEADVLSVGAPGEDELTAFYRDNPDLFTQPARKRVAVILLAVAPSAGAAAMAAAREEADQIVERLSGGADFAEQAGLYSSDPSAANGGDMGYMHEGTLSPDAEAVIAELDIGGVSDPVRVLEGIAIFKLLERKAAELQSFVNVRDRAEGLWIRQAGEQQWEKLVAELRAGSEIDIDTDYLVNVSGYND